MKIGVIGCGIVGGALIKALEKAHSIVAWDKFKKSLNKLEDFVACDCIFVAVPTPILKSGAIDKSALYDSMEILKGVGMKNKVVVIKSTAVSGTTDELANAYPEFKFAFCPEFLRENTAIQDMLDADRHIIGADDPEVHALVKKVFVEAGYAEDKCKYVLVDRKTAELIKYIANTYLATKITFANEIYNICEALGVNYEAVVDAVCLDSRIDRSYGWRVLGDGGKGFSGKCFPKDLSAFIYLARESGYDPHLLREVWRSNLSFRGLNR